MARGWVKEHQGEDSSILANVGTGANDAGKKDDAKKKEEKKDKKDIKDKEGRGGIDGAGDESSSSSSEDFVHENDVATITRTTRGRPRGLATVVKGTPEEEQRHGCGHGGDGRKGENGGIPDPSDVVARADEKVGLSEQKQEVEKKTDEVLREAAARRASTRTRRTLWPKRRGGENGRAASRRRRHHHRRSARRVPTRVRPGAAVPSSSTRAAGTGTRGGGEGKPRRISSPGEGDCFDQSHQP